MAMDLVRSCYKTEMRFFNDDDLAIKVRWFFCVEGAQIFPFHTLFGSGNWASDRFNWPGPGEVLDAPRIWDPGEPIEGLDGQHYCGPDLSYAEGTEYPGVPLNALPDGRCACCAPVPTPCFDLVATLPNTLRMRILNITLEPDTSPASIYAIGDEFDFDLSAPAPRAWFCSTPFFRDGCAFDSQFGLSCRPWPEGNRLTLICDGNGVETPVQLISETPFRAYFNFVNIANTACMTLGDGAEYWDVVIFDPAFPP